MLLIVQFNNAAKYIKIGSDPSNEANSSWEQFNNAVVQKFENLRNVSYIVKDCDGIQVDEEIFEDLIGPKEKFYIEIPPEACAYSITDQRAVIKSIKDADFQQDISYRVTDQRADFGKPIKDADFQHVRFKRVTDQRADFGKPIKDADFQHVRFNSITDQRAVIKSIKDADFQRDISYSVTDQKAVTRKSIKDADLQVDIFNRVTDQRVVIRNSVGAQLEKKTGMGLGAKIAIGATIGACTLVVGAPLLLASAGFGAAGIVAGSFAAAVQSSIGAVAAGSLFAGLQSAGAAGIGLVGVAAAGTVGAAAGATTAVATANSNARWIEKLREAFDRFACEDALTIEGLCLVIKYLGVDIERKLLENLMRQFSTSAGKNLLPFQPFLKLIIELTNMLKK